jgi:hypothetical protein
MPEASVGFWGHLRRRIIVISTMERDVRIAFMAGFTLVVLAIALNIFHEHLGPSIHILIGTIPLGVIAVLALGEFAVFFLISLAIFLLKARWRYIAHALILISFLGFTAVNDFEILSFALVVPMAMLWVFSFLGHRQGWVGRDYVLGALSTSLAAMLIFVLYLATGRELLIISALAGQGLVGMLGLCMAATDIAELIVVAVESATAKVPKLFSAVGVALVFAIGAILANVLVTLTTTDWSARVIAQYLGSGTGLALWLGLIYWMVISRRKRLGSVHPGIDYSALFLIVGFYFVALQAGIALRFLSDPLTYRARNLFTYPQAFVFTTFGALVFIVLFLIFGRRSERMLIRLAYGAAVGLFIFHYYSSQGSNIVLIIDAVAIGSVLLLIFARLSRKMRQHYASACLIVADVNLAFFAYALLATLFLGLGGHGNGGALSSGQALIVLAALAWDILSSGEAITNRHTDTFPRLSRVAIFIAYIVSVALLVMVSTAGEFVDPINGEAVEGLFDSERLVALGLVLFGAPFIFVMGALRFRNLLAAADAQATAAHAAAAEQPGPTKSQDSDVAPSPA